MEIFDNARIKWPYVTHLVDRSLVTGVLPPVEETNPGGLVLARVLTIGKHKELEAHDGRRMALFTGDVFAGVLGNRYATDQFEGVARCSGGQGHSVIVKPVSNFSSLITRRTLSITQLLIAFGSGGYTCTAAS